ncbi:MAG TPA: peptidoglycan DD-metalloendopeptidase family protein [Pyrinomonadaceae bacterium]|nr:peptidoglycan DD-metalloendopeptidase family protein [Pyrinomonadaceae bacterium]
MKVLSPAEIGNTAPPDRAAANAEAAIRKVAVQFEALLLSQLTQSLNGSEEDGLFSSGGGMGLSRQLFSEQLATTMAESGGVGLADMILKQFTDRAAKKSNVLKSVTAASEPAANSAAPTPVDVNLAAHATRPRRVFSVANDEAAAPEPVQTATIPTSLRMKERPGHAAKEVDLHLPVNGPIRSVFGMRRDPINGRIRLHKGVDIAARRGTPIEAAAEGQVVFAGRNRGYGNMVMIEHSDGRQTLYAHAERLFVKPGDRVAAGQTIAAVGSTGHSTGPHLHFEIREGKTAVNPLKSLIKDLALARR